MGAIEKVPMTKLRRNIGKFHDTVKEKKIVKITKYNKTVLVAMTYEMYVNLIKGVEYYKKQASKT